MLPLRPHLYWGGTSCPGTRWPEWVPQLRKEEDMPLTPEDIEAVAVAVEKKMLTHTNFLGDLINAQGGIRDEQFNELFGETRLGYIVKLLDELPGKVPGGGSTPDEIKEALKDAQREGTG